jgi:hypothetical protein
VTGVGNNVESNGLADTLNEWESMKIISKKEGSKERIYCGWSRQGQRDMLVQGKMQQQSLQLQKGRKNLLLSLSLKQL